MNFDTYISQIRHMEPGSHKGQNGKVMLIGGSELFHAASRWSMDVLSAMVDMVFYSSVPTNNELIREAKGEFWGGVVVPRGDVENYIQEADVILIGPGMTRDSETEKITNDLLKKYTNKKWVIDAGALQMLDVKLLNEHMIVTPHQGEYEGLQAKFQNPNSKIQTKATILLKGKVDTVMQEERTETITGGNPGMTKGGTGDVLAGLVAGLYCFTDDPFAAAVVGSFVNKKAGDKLYKFVGPFFTTAQLVEQIPKTLKEVLSY
ncbi:MAG TPA: NAD(P)H-hydrate dehydratase [Patescibacteria group bacterium]|nr:NAD(P)H-hydrate dehydratase [Patescibacteria group bacterium]